MIERQKEKRQRMNLDYEQSKQYQTFLAPGDNAVYCSTRALMGLNCSMGIACAISTIVWGALLHLVYVDNLMGKKPTMREMIDNMVEALERARSLGAVLKLKEMFVGLTTRDTTFELLGYALERDF